jgi:hypothetical protein
MTNFLGLPQRELKNKEFFAEGKKGQKHEWGGGKGGGSSK